MKFKCNDSILIWIVGLGFPATLITFFEHTFTEAYVSTAVLLAMMLGSYIRNLEKRNAKKDVLVEVCK